jgi:hypothetical protein
MREIGRALMDAGIPKAFYWEIFAGLLHHRLDSRKSPVLTGGRYELVGSPAYQALKSLMQPQALASGASHGLVVNLHRDSYAVGEAPRYSLKGGVPGARICWTSLIDREFSGNLVPTGENAACYGHFADSSGSWEAWGGEWIPEWKGDWIKRAVLLDPLGQPLLDENGSPVQADVRFSVR